MKFNVKPGMSIPGITARGPFVGQIVERPIELTKKPGPIQTIGFFENEAVVYLFVPGMGGGWTEVPLQSVVPAE